MRQAAGLATAFGISQADKAKVSWSGEAKKSGSPNAGDAKTASCAMGSIVIIVMSIATGSLCGRDPKTYRTRRSRETSSGLCCNPIDHVMDKLDNLQCSSTDLRIPTGAQRWRACCRFGRTDLVLCPGK